MTWNIRQLAVVAVVFANANPATAHVVSPPAEPEASAVEADRVAKRKRRRKQKPKPASAGPKTTVFGKNLPPAPALQERRGRKSVALLPLQAIEIPEDLQVAIENDLLTEIDEAGKYSAVTPADVRADLARLKDKNPAFTAPFETENCNGNSECLSIAGRYARAHFAIETRVSGVGGTVKIALRMFDTRSRKEIARTADVISERPPAKRTRELHRLMVQLLRPKSYVGSLTVVCDEPGAEVYLNDELVGTSPLKGAIRGLAAGPYILRVTKDGYSDVYQFVDVVYRKVSTYRVNMNENTIASELVEEESERGFGQVYVYAESGEFDLRIDGDPRGKVPLDGTPLAQVAAGNRRISLRYEGGDPIVEPVPVEAGRRTDVIVKATADGGYEISATEVVDSDAPLPSAATLAAVAIDDPVGPVVPVEPREFGWRYTSGIVLGAAGALSLLTGAYLSTVVASFDDEADALRAVDLEADSVAAQRANDLNDKGPTAETQQYVAYGAGVLFLAAGAGLVLWDMARVAEPPEPEATVSDETALGISAAPLSGGGMVGLHWRF